MPVYSKAVKISLKSLLVLGLALLVIHPGFARDKYETIEAQAFGTGTQMGQNIGVTLNIYEFSTPADRTDLMQAYEKGQNQGLVNALQRMKAVGHVEITGTLGIRLLLHQDDSDANGAQDRLRYQPADPVWGSLFRHQSQSFNLTAGVIELNDQDKSKSTGLLYPAAQLVLKKRASCNWI